MKTLKEIEKIRSDSVRVLGKGSDRQKTRILVGMSTCGIAAGANAVYDKILEVIKENNLYDVQVVKTGCIGMCPLEPIVEVLKPGEDKVTYVNVDHNKIKDIIDKHIVGGQLASEYLFHKAGKNFSKIDKVNFLTKQYRIALRNCGVINPEDIDEYIGVNGYQGLVKALTEMNPTEVLEIVKDSGIRGRGGGGFPTGIKWELAAKQVDPIKYMICNADEGDPGAFMDRSVLEGDPHSVLEAMAIAGYAIGASKGFIYVRAEYPVAVKRLKIAIGQVKDYGLLGKNILGLGFDFDIEIRLGAGAFVCGEETALMNSIEGMRGMPNPKPPFPAVSGLFGNPTIINNVETFANIPEIINKGAKWFKSIGTEKSKGTKVFALGGKIQNTGLVEVPMGITLREVIFDIGGGIPKGKEFKAVQTGGPSGGCITKEHLDTIIDYDTLTELGSMMGSGGMIVMDEDNCMVDVAKFYLDFTKDESCGKCTPCRIGTTRLLEILTKITEGKGTLKDLESLESLSYQIKAASLCGLGQTAPNPVLSTLKYFKNEYLAHVVDKKCPSGVCKSLIKYSILQDVCKGCTICAKQCPTNAIRGERKQAHHIDLDLCIKCGSCYDVCRFQAIVKE